MLCLRVRKGELMPIGDNGKKKTENGIFDELDDFWQLDALLPPRSAPSRRSSNVETVEVSLGEGDKTSGMERFENAGEECIGNGVSPRNGSSVGGSGIFRNNGAQNGGSGGKYQSPATRKYPPITRSGGKINFDEWLKRRNEGERGYGSAEANDEVFEYTPDNPLIFNVKVIRRRGFEGASEPSIAEMREHFHLTAEFKGNVEYDSLFPKLSRMTEEQRLCYIGFRTEVFAGRYPEISSSYILFLLYEIINLTDLIPPERGVDIICSLMREYHRCDEGLFANMCDWLQDYCLINRLGAPFKQLESIRAMVYKKAVWKEFYVPFNATVAEPDACVMLNTASSYDYRTSKFYTAETAECFETHIPKAIGCAVRSLSVTDPLGLQGELSAEAVKRNVTTLTHEAFRGAFRGTDKRYTVSIECACFTRSAILRQMITGWVKYAENFVREMLGIRSRVSVSNVSSEGATLIKEYFDPFIKRDPERPPLKRGRKKKIIDPAEVAYKPTVPEYEKYYEPKQEGFSPERAAQIEKQSWAVTDMLIQAFDDSGILDDAREFERGGDEIDTEPIEVVRLHEDASAERSDDTAANRSKPADKKNSPVIDGLGLLLAGKNGEFKALAMASGILAETLAERINELALEEYGDIAVESDDGFNTFRLVEDYMAELTEIYNSKK